MHILPDSCSEPDIVTRLVGVSVLLGLFFLALSFFGRLLVFIASLDHGTQEGVFALSEHDLVLLMRIYATVCPLVGGTIALLMRLHRHINLPALWVKFVAFTVSSSALLFILLTELAKERQFYPLGIILAAPETLDVFGRRLLLVWPARWMYLHVAGLSPLHVYYVTQAAAICVTVSLIGIWSARFVGWRNAYLGQMLLIVLVCPTFSYHNYYDIFIIATFTGALLCLWDRRYLVFCLIAGIGTLNHENTLILAFVALAVCYRRETRRKVAAVVGGTLMAWLIAKVGISIAVPMHASFHYRVITNLWQPVHQPRAILFSLVELSPMFLCTVLGWSEASRRLRCSAFMLVPLLAVTYVFGQFEESRQFYAFIPIAIAFALSALPRVESEVGHEDEDQLFTHLGADVSKAT